MLNNFNVQLLLHRIICLLLAIPNINSIEWFSSFAADAEGNYHIYWTTEQDVITFEIQVRTLGYVGIGFSEQGAMKGSDIVIGWVNSSQAELQDRFVADNDELLMDKSQDYELLSGYENETHTVLRFQRKINTCDDNDYLLTRDSVYLIYYWHQEDLTSNQAINFNETQNKGTVLAELFVRPEDNAVVATEDISIWDLLNNNVTINTDTTPYWCTFHLIKGDMKQLIGSIPVLQSGHENLVHHMKFFRCRNDAFDQISNFSTGGIDCTSDAIHSELLYICDDFIAGYTVGVDSVFFHHDAGYPLGMNDKDSYFMLDTHYNNKVKGTPPFVDNSGIRLYLTKKLKKLDAGMIFLQTETNYSVMIPPKQKSFMLVTHFPVECTAKFIPEGGITIDAALFHAHYNARQFRLRHFRNGIELPTIFTVSNYNFNRQINYRLQPERKLLPGDFLTLECTFNTENEDEVVFGGLDSFNEMCLVILSHYPRIKVDNIYLGLSLEQMNQLMQEQSTINGEEVGKNTTFTEYFKNYNWNSSVGHDFIIKLQKRMKDDELRGACYHGPTNLATFSTAYPTITSPYVEPATKC